MPSDISAKAFLKQHEHFLISNPDIFFSYSDKSISHSNQEIMTRVNEINVADLVLLYNLLNSETSSDYEEQRRANKKPSLAEVLADPTQLHPNVKQKLKSMVYNASI